MKSLVAAMATLFVVDYLFYFMGRPEFLSYFLFDRELIFSGQVWRIISFIILPPNTMPLFIIFALYLFWIMGTFLEQFWGVLKFNLFYFSGVLFTIIGGLIMGYTNNVYLNLSIFLAFAIINPNFVLRLFFIIPVKIKYLAILDVCLYVVIFIISTWPVRVAIIISLLNIFIFFGGTMYKGTKSFLRRTTSRIKWKYKTRSFK